MKHTTHYETEFVTNLGEKIGELVPQIIGEANSLSNFKSKVKEWIPKTCLCRFYKTYVAAVGCMTFMVNPLMAGRLSSHINLRSHAVFCFYGLLMDTRH